MISYLKLGLSILNGVTSDRRDTECNGKGGLSEKRKYVVREGCYKRYNK